MVSHASGELASAALDGLGLLGVTSRTFGTFEDLVAPGARTLHGDRQIHSVAQVALRRRCGFHVYDRVWFGDSPGFPVTIFCCAEVRLQPFLPNVDGS